MILFNSCIMDQLKQQLNEIYDITNNAAFAKIEHIIRQKFGWTIFELFTDLEQLSNAERWTPEQKLYFTLDWVDLGNYSQNLLRVRGEGILSENQFEVIHQIGILSNTYWQLFENYERLKENQLICELNVNYISQYLHTHWEEPLIWLTRDVHKMFNNLVDWSSWEGTDNHDNIE